MHGATHAEERSLAMSSAQLRHLPSVTPTSFKRPPPLRMACCDAATVRNRKNCKINRSTCQRVRVDSIAAGADCELADTLMYKMQRPHTLVHGEFQQHTTNMQQNSVLLCVPPNRLYDDCVRETSNFLRHSRWWSERQLLRRAQRGRWHCCQMCAAHPLDMTTEAMCGSV